MGGKVADLLSKSQTITGSSFRYPLVICFGKSTCAGYPTAVLHARLTKNYREHREAGALTHYCCISKMHEEFARAAAIIELLRLSRSLSVYADGSPVGNLHHLTAVLNCYLQAERCNDPTAHCHVVEEEQRPQVGVFVTLRVPIDWNERPRRGPPDVIPRHIFPCALLHTGFRLQRGHPAEVADQIQAAGVKRGCHICPHFRPQDYREIAPRVVHADGTEE